MKLIIRVEDAIMIDFEGVVQEFAVFISHPDVQNLLKSLCKRIEGVK